jgi:bis(5'-nucleosidyl)-tetraphosphatase
MQEAAGIIIVRDAQSGHEVLCLRSYSSYDLPKGHIEDNETNMQAAIRETHEEAGLDDITFPWGVEPIFVVKPGKRSKRVALFVGRTSQTPHLCPNPLSGIYEHHEVVWFSLDEAEKQLHPYLRTAIAHVRKVVQLKQDV